MVERTAAKRLQHAAILAPSRGRALGCPESMPVFLRQDLALRWILTNVLVVAADIRVDR
jgi:hypothetical protein